MLIDLKGMTRIERCKEAGLETLESSREDQDLSQTFKILKGIDKVKKRTYSKEWEENKEKYREATHGIGKERIKG